MSVKYTDTIARYLRANKYPHILVVDANGTTLSCNTLNEASLDSTARGYAIKGYEDMPKYVSDWAENIAEIVAHFIKKGSFASNAIPEHFYISFPPHTGGQRQFRLIDCSKFAQGGKYHSCFNGQNRVAEIEGDRDTSPYSSTGRNNLSGYAPIGGGSAGRNRASSAARTPNG